MPISNLATNINKAVKEYTEGNITIRNHNGIKEQLDSEYPDYGFLNRSDYIMFILSNRDKIINKLK